MNICLIVDDYLPQSTKAGAKMMHELAQQFALMGHSVSVVTPSATLKKRLEISELDGITVLRFRSGELKNVSKVKRAVNETMLSHTAWKSLKRYFSDNHHELIVYYSPTIFWGILVRKLKKLWSAKSYLVLRDFFPQWAIDSGLLKENSPITGYFRFFEQINYTVADKIALQSQENLNWFAKKNGKGAPLEILYNWSGDAPTVACVGNYRKALGLEDKVVYFYGGNIGHAQDMMNIVRLAKALINEKHAHFVLVGSGDEFELVQRTISEGKLSNMTLLNAVTQDEYKMMLAEFDIGLFSLHKNHVTHNFPGKLLGYMREGKPILGSINPGNDVRGIFESEGAGLITINGDDKDFYENAVKLLCDESLRKCVGIKANKLLHQKFSVGAAAQKILASSATL